MHLLRRGIVRRIGGFAASCAILLLSIAPLASQMLAHARTDLRFASLCVSGASGAKSVKQSHGSHDTASTFDACGYCNLATHAPTPPVIAQDGPRIEPMRDGFTQRIAIDTPLASMRTRQQPRAPPSLA
jgi:hypothetical protein